MPNPRGDRSRDFVSFAERKRKRFIRALLRYCIASAGLFALLAAIYYQTDTRWLVVDAALDFKIGKCEFYVHKREDILEVNCYRY